MRSDRTVKRDAFSRSFRSTGILMISLSAVAVAYAQSIAGTWQGILPVGQSPRIVLRIADAGNGALRVSITFIDRSADVLRLLSTTYRAPNLTAAVSDITFRGKLSADGKSIAGTWTRRVGRRGRKQQKAAPETAPEKAVSEP